MILRLASLVFVCLLLGGCGRSWLVGKWVVDRETTVANFSSEAKAPAETAGEGFLKELVAGLQKGASRLLVAQFEGVEIEFTPTEMRRIRNGVGEAIGYKIIERPEAGRLVVQYDDGEIMTWSRGENGIRMRLPGEEEHWIHFKAAAK